MIRRSKHILKFSNKSKLDVLDSIYSNCKLQLETYIDQIISGKQELTKMITSKLLSSEFIEHSIWKQMCYIQASQIIRSQTKKSNNDRFKSYRKIYAKLKETGRYNKFTSKKFSELNLKPVYQTKYFTKPILNNVSIIIPKILTDSCYSSKEFDSFIRLTTPNIKKINKIRNHYHTINIPIKQHKHSNKYRADISWKQSNSIGLQKINGNFYFNIFWEKDDAQKKTTGKSIGLDCGYKKLLISSENKTYDVGLERVYEKISRKKQGSKNFKQALVERDNLINQSVNQIKTRDIQTIVVEDLKNVKKDSKGKIRKKFNNKLQRWSYLKVLNKLSMLTEENGINLIKVNPAYTSQTCSRCGSIHKESRKGEKYLCIDCGYELDADLNASINILHRGVYSPSTDKANFQILH
jgi:IS605 OrfB family transposase